MQQLRERVFFPNAEPNDDDDGREEAADGRELHHQLVEQTTTKWVAS